MGGVLHDAVTLRHFAAIGCLEVCEAVHGALPEPRWVEAVQQEISRHATQFGIAYCVDILNAPWLGAPVIPELKDAREVYKIQIGLNEGVAPATTKDRGEAESIFFAERLEATFATDDNAAYDFAVRRLGIGRAIDTVTILQKAVANGDITRATALAHADAMRAADRALCSVHPDTLTAEYFD